VTVQEPSTALAQAEDVTLVDLVDRLLGKGVCVAGDVVISVAGVDLLYLNLRALLAAVDTAMEQQIGPEFK
jgi:hypothetical protein